MSFTDLALLMKQNGNTLDGNELSTEHVDGKVRKLHLNINLRRKKILTNALDRLSSKHRSRLRLLSSFLLSFLSTARSLPLSSLPSFLDLSNLIYHPYLLTSCIYRLPSSVAAVPVFTFVIRKALSMCHSSKRSISLVFGLSLSTGREE